VAAANECTSAMGHFDGHGDAPVRYEAHLPMQHYQGFRPKQLDATIGQLLAPYRPGGRQGDDQHNNYAKCTHFAGHFDGHRDAPVLYRVHRLMEDVRGFHIIH